LFFKLIFYSAAAAQNMEFLATVPNKDLLEEMKVQNQAIVHKTITNGTPDGKQQMIRYLIFYIFKD
jgi:hypothetical protein